MTVQTDDLEVEPTDELPELVEDPPETEDAGEAIEEPEPSEEDEEKPKLSRNQNAKQRLKRKLATEQAENARIRQENNDLKERFGALEKKVDGVINPPPDRPQRVDFETEESYEDSLFDWRDQTKAVDTPAPPAPSAPKALPPEIQQNWDKQMDDGIDKHDDFTEVIHSIKPENMTDMMAGAIFEAKNGGDVAYFLGQNPGEASRIARLNATGQIRALDKLSVKFKPSTTTAPDPITPTKGDVAPAKSLENMSPEEYRQHRREQRAAR